MFLKPSSVGLKVRDPKTGRHLPDSGANVRASTYWLRRLAQGDVVEVIQIPDSVE